MTQINSLIVTKNEKELFRIAKDGNVFVESRLMGKNTELADIIWNLYCDLIPTYDETANVVAAINYNLQDDVH